MKKIFVLLITFIILIISSTTIFTIASENKKSYLEAIAPLNQQVEENGFLYLADFECYNEVCQITYGGCFGKIEMSKDHVTHGDYSLKINLFGWENTRGRENPYIQIYTSMEYFRKENFSDCDYVEIDIYNENDFDYNISFVPIVSPQAHYAYYHEYLETKTIMPGNNTLRFSLSTSASLGKQYYGVSFSFARAEDYEVQRVLYIDGIRVHYIEN